MHGCCSRLLNPVDVLVFTVKARATSTCVAAVGSPIAEKEGASGDNEVAIKHGCMLWMQLHHTHNAVTRMFYIETLTLRYL